MYVCWDWKSPEIIFLKSFCFAPSRPRKNINLSWRLLRTVVCLNERNFGIFKVTISPWFHFINAIFLKTFLQFQEKRIILTKAAFPFVENTVGELSAELYSEILELPGYFSCHKITETLSAPLRYFTFQRNNVWMGDLYLKLWNIFNIWLWDFNFLLPESILKLSGQFHNSLSCCVWHCVYLCEYLCRSTFSELQYKFVLLFCVKCLWLCVGYCEMRFHHRLKAIFKVLTGTMSLHRSRFATCWNLWAQWTACSNKMLS